MAGTPGILKVLWLVTQPCPRKEQIKYKTPVISFYLNFVIYLELFVIYLELYIFLLVSRLNLSFLCKLIRKSLNLKFPEWFPLRCDHKSYSRYILVLPIQQPVPKYYHVYKNTLFDIHPEFTTVVDSL